jgi:signal peptidase I
MLFDRKTMVMFKNKMKKDGFIDLPSDGSSMYPLLKIGDICRFISVNPLKLKKGDIILFHSKAGQLIGHRYFYTKKLEGTLYYFLKGDTNLAFDQPITEEQIIGKLTFIQRRDKTIHIENLSASLWGWLILSIPALSGFLRRYINMKNQYQF